MKSALWALAVVGLIATTGLAACGQGGEPAGQSAPAAQTLAWEGLVEGVSIAPQADGSVMITPSATVEGYQAGVTVPLEGSRSLAFQYDVTLNGGPGFIGVLAGDGSRWLGNYELLPGQRNTNSVTVPVEGDSVLIVIQTGPNQIEGTNFLLHRVAYDLQ